MRTEEELQRLQDENPEVWDENHRVAVAVEQTLPPAVRELWADRVIARTLAAAMTAGDLDARITPWWRASSAEAITTVERATRLPRGDASCIVGAVAHSLVLTGGDLTAYEVTERAIRAGFFHQGSRYGRLWASLAVS